MAQTFDEQLRHALELVADRVGRDLTEECGRVANELSVIAAVERAESETRMTVAAQQARDAAAAPFLKLVDAVRALDAASTLSEALDALAAGARDQTAQFALFLVRGDRLRVWATHGFPHDETSAEVIFSGSELPLVVSGVLADVVRVSDLRRIEAGVQEGRPAFASDASCALVVLPVAMNQDVAAVVCGSEPTGDAEQQQGSIALEVLARHAGRVLESMTTRRLAQLDRPYHVHVAPPSAVQVQDRP